MIKGQHHSKESKKLMSLAHKGKILTIEHRRKIGESGKGRIFSLESRLKISIANKRSHNTDSYKRKYSGSGNPAWTGGRHIGSDGYVLIYNPNHLFADSRGYIKEHRLVLENILGRILKRQESPHHINRIRDDNRPQNLILFRSEKAHKRFEHNITIGSDDIIFDGRI